MRDDLQRLKDMLEAVDRIQRHVGISREEFEDDELVQIWMTHHLQIIGEAASRVSPELRRRYPNVPWAAIAAMRNVIVHAYFDVDNDEVWSAVVQDIPKLRRDLETITLQESPGQQGT